MNGFLAAGIALLACTAPCLFVAWRGKVMDTVIALELVVDIVVLVLVVLAQGFGRSGEMAIPLVLAALSLGGALVFIRILERWL